LSLSSIVLTVLGLGLHLAFVVLRAAATGFLPFASRFEALVLFALAVQATGLVVYSTTRQNSVKAGTDLLSTALLAGAILPVGFHPVTELNPMLDSPWFAVHILAAFCGYGCFSAGLVWSLVHLFDRTLDAAPAVPRRLALSGLFLLGTGILTGAAWADSAWGTYWNWDPKESWALLTWSIMLVYVHHRSGRLRDVLFFGLTFVAMMFTFVGINLLKWGLHRY
jgi:ABC-type transport system involved in cytochrome c biogenesis permease subunit